MSMVELQDASISAHRRMDLSIDWNFHDFQALVYLCNGNISAVRCGAYSTEVRKFHTKSVQVVCPSTSEHSKQVTTLAMERVGCLVRSGSSTS